MLNNAEKGGVALAAYIANDKDTTKASYDAAIAGAITGLVIALGHRMLEQMDSPEAKLQNRKMEKIRGGWIR